MKKIKLILSLIAMFAFVSNGFGQTLADSKHDFIGATWNDATSNQACGPCHTPHATITGAGPLWSHVGTTQGGSFTPYSNATINATDLGQPDGISASCLGCHDGTTDISNHKGGELGSVTIPGSSVGLVLTNDHPISFTYDATLVSADGQLAATGTDISAEFGANATIANTLLFSGKMQCASCHDAHGSVVTVGLLRHANTQSQLCLACHTK